MTLLLEIRGRRMGRVAGGGGDRATGLVGLEIVFRLVICSGWVEELFRRKGWTVGALPRMDNPSAVRGCLKIDPRGDLDTGLAADLRLFVGEVALVAVTALLTVGETTRAEP
jgi:hypothetical protein